MRTTLTENAGLPASVLWTLAIVAGVTVANIYYNQPLLNLISHELGVSEFQTGLIAMVTQTGYALGLLFIIPLGDLFQRRRIILTSFTLLTVALLATAFSHHIGLIMAASLLTGTCSVMPQLFIPIAAQYSEPSRKGRNVGIVVSGLLTGILASRVVSGFVGEWLGWREMYLIATVLMLVCMVVVWKTIPEIQTNFQGTYRGLMRSLLTLVRQYPQLRTAAARAALAFGSFLAMWSCLAFKMSQAPFYASSHIIGLLGLCGVAGALSASFVGRYVKQVGVERFNYIGCGFLLLAWSCFYWGNQSYAGIIAGILLIDIGMQCIQLSNQTCIFELNPKASNRINTIFMTTYFIGGSTGTFLGNLGWKWMDWPGVVLMGVLLTAGSLAITIFHRK